METKQRLDAYLVENRFASGREKAKELIRDGAVSVNGKIVTKASFGVADGDEVLCGKEACAFVGRGGVKLEKALREAQLSIDGGTAMDVGASTGGFTHCLLQNGVAKVYAVDVGHGQLHPSLCADARVENWEGTDIRSERLCAAVPPACIDILTADVSFISLRQILPYALPFLKKEGHLVLLIKPQFEAGKADVGKNGIVRDRAVHIRILRELTAFFEEQGCCPERLLASPITGGAGRQRGNIEYLAVLTYNGRPAPIFDFRRIVDETFDSFSDREVSI